MLIRIISDKVQQIIEWAESCSKTGNPWLAELDELQNRMSQSGAHIRNIHSLDMELAKAWEQVHRIRVNGVKVESIDFLRYAFRVRQLAFAHAVYLDAIKYSLDSGVGSRGSSIVLSEKGQQVHKLLDISMKIAPEDTSFRKQVLETICKKDGSVMHQWIPCRPIPESDAWFETTWARYRNGDIYS